MLKYLATTVFVLSYLSNVQSDRCVMRGTCEEDEITGLNKPCVYDGEPTILEHAPSQKYLQEVCPTLMTGPNDKVCCDADQVEAFQSSMSVLASLFKKCPACFHNLANILCHLICSPHQSTFLKVTSLSGKKAVDEMSYYVSENFAQGLFDSCSNVKIPGTKMNAMEISCGAHSLNCSPHLWLEYIGGHGPSPYQINFHFTQNVIVVVNGTTFYPMNETAVPCYEAVTPDGPGCTRADCPCDPFPLQ